MMPSQSKSANVKTLLRPADTAIHGIRPGAVRLTVRDLGRMRRFWTHSIGLAEIGSTGNVLQFGVGQRVLIELEHVPSAPLPPRNATGLFHVALLFAARSELADALRRVLQSGARLSGASDHLVSEALYLDDPEGNGVELYWDRPRHQWPWSDQGLKLASDRLDLEDLLGGNDPFKATSAVVPEMTVIGHVHLKVSDVAVSENWYRTILGLDVTSALPSASFLSSDGYHHHIGMNTWSSAACPTAEIGSQGLAGFELVLPAAAVNDVAERLAGKNFAHVRHDGLTVRDPSGIQIRLRETS
ncbi:VOC family protein [Rhizobium sp. CF122]|uniref:VOC family protein n=1 Tax=Rhizobium sp. CF122 TaxID=1144312 RepID=UPI00068A042F|nr:VOC family protein [Rhizobium sp. CF122]